MNFWSKKIASILTVLFLTLPLFSCEEGCVDADEFDVHSIEIESNPVEDGIYGYYDKDTGGQRANWHETGLKSNGDMFLMQISGSWIALLGLETSGAAIETMNRCNFCAKRYDDSSPNCICYKNQTPTPEIGIGGVAANVDCSDPDNQDDPLSCTCTKQHGEATDYGVYHFPLNILDKNENTLVPDKQTNCRYDRGMGAYVALWGNRGATTPQRAYHLFTEDEVCNVARNSNGQCLDSKGRDATRYVFRSANNRIFMKDDSDGNENIDNDTSDDTYHNANENLKTIMYDRYYSDNQGQYNVKIFRGVGSENEPGLLEFLVSLVESVLLGEIGEDGERKGGLIEFMYKSIIHDSGFALFAQLMLTLYIALFGIAHLFGVVEISNRKEILTRVMKIALIVFFISEGSWYFYEKIVVSFFKDSMDYFVAMIMDLQDAKFDATTMVKIAQMDRAIDVSNATRFSYVDMIIRNLMSAATAKKIFGLFFSSIFGILYIPAIYALIAFFIYVMLFVASLYIANLVKLIFVLSLGPIFMVFSLFSKTQQMFKNWLGFLGGRSMEMVVLFTILYLFLNLIDKAFTDLLFFPACAVNKGIGPIKLIVWISDVDRSFIEWVMKFLGVGALIFITNLVIQKVPEVVNEIVSIGGVGAGSSAAMASGLLAGAISSGKDAGGYLLGKAETFARYAAKGATFLARKTGLANAWNSAFGKIPFNSPRTFYRNSIIDGAIKRAEAQAGSRTGKERDQFIRENTVKSLQNLMIGNDKTKFALAGVDMTNISERLDKKLLQDPLKKFIAKEAKDRKYRGAANMKFGKEAQDELKAEAVKWANKNLYDGAGDRVNQLFRDSGKLNGLVNAKTELSSSRAAKIFAGDEDGKKRYMQYLTDKDAANKAKQQEASKNWYKKLPNALGRAYDKLSRNKADNPKQMQKAFMRKTWQKENDKSWYQRGRFMNQDAITKNRRDAQKSMLLDNMASGHNAAYARDRLLHLEGQNIPKGFDKIRAERDALRDSLNSMNGKELMVGMARLANLNEQFAKKKHRDPSGAYSGIVEGYTNDRLKMLGNMSDADKKRELERLTELALFNSGAQLGNVDAMSQKYSGITDANYEQAKDSYGIAASKLDVQFGASVSQALLQDPDIGLKASNVGLGVTPKDESAISQNAVNALRLSRNQVSAKLKMDKMGKQLNEFRIAKLQEKARFEKLDAKEERELNDLTKEVADLDRDIRSYEDEVTRLDSDISKYDK